MTAAVTPRDDGFRSPTSLAYCGARRGAIDSRVDDDATFRETLARAFRDRGYRVHTAADVRAALASATTDTPDFAVVDFNLGTEPGSDVLSGLLALCPLVRVAMLTGSRSVDAADIIRRGGIACLRKPAEVDHILALLNGDATTAT